MFMYDLIFFRHFEAWETFSVEWWRVINQPSSSTLYFYITIIVLFTWTDLYLAALVTLDQKKQITNIIKPLIYYDDVWVQVANTQQYKS